METYTCAEKMLSKCPKCCQWLFLRFSILEKHTIPFIWHLVEPSTPL
jgi:hypothetical protein